MAFTVVNSPGNSPVPASFGTLRGNTVDLNITSYTTGGETLVPANLGMSRIIGVTSIACPAGYVVNFVRATNKVTIARDNGTATAAALPEIPNATNFGAIGVLSLLVIGA